MLKVLLVTIFTIAELNCENLFDCRHDSLKDDWEFLPDSERNWTPRRYWNKINGLGKEILSMADGLPDVVCLTEVENNTTLHNLTQHSPSTSTLQSTLTPHSTSTLLSTSPNSTSTLSTPPYSTSPNSSSPNSSSPHFSSPLHNAGYEYIMTNSPDPRGLDVALLYQPQKFKLLFADTIRITPNTNTKPTRDILHVCGLVRNSNNILDTLHIYVVHFPSRRGGAKETEAYRKHVAQTLLQHINKLNADVDLNLNSNSNSNSKSNSNSNSSSNSNSNSKSNSNSNSSSNSDSNSDLNSNSDSNSDSKPKPKPHNTSHTSYIIVGDFNDYKNDESLKLFYEQGFSNRAMEGKVKGKYNNVEGTYKFQGKWNSLDHILIKGSIKEKVIDSYINDQDFLLTGEGDKLAPYRTYRGNFYQGGYSDHLPLVFTFDLDL